MPLSLKMILHFRSQEFLALRENFRCRAPKFRVVAIEMSVQLSRKREPDFSCLASPTIKENHP